MKLSESGTFNLELLRFNRHESFYQNEIIERAKRITGGKRVEARLVSAIHNRHVLNVRAVRAYIRLIEQDYDYPNKAEDQRMADRIWFQRLNEALVLLAIPLVNFFM